MIKSYSKLSEALIKAVSELVSAELTGYIVYDGNDTTIFNPDYSKEKGMLIDMIKDCNRKMGLETKGE